ncbi:MAG: hypothetical protein MJE77_23640 [Proteobacteria bacterium]|nr:hypothetical protein [Pseudomonadota bacterium]
MALEYVVDTDAPSADIDVAQAPEANKAGLPDRLKAGVERLSGLSMDDVRVHYNSSKAAPLQALAYTQGTVSVSSELINTVSMEQTAPVMAEQSCSERA